MKLPRAALAAPVLALACGGAVEEVPAPSLDEHHPRFVGTWVVEEEAARGGYAGALWELAADGGLARVAVVERSGDAHVLGTVTNEVATCAFGSRWASAGPDVLVLEGRCTDGRPRAIELDFAVDPSRNETHRAPTVLRVGGEEGWSRGGPWGWAIRKCATEECVAAFR